MKPCRATMAKCRLRDTPVRSVRATAGREPRALGQTRPLKARARAAASSALGAPKGLAPAATRCQHAPSQATHTGIAPRVGPTLTADSSQNYVRGRCRPEVREVGAGPICGGLGAHQPPPVGNGPRGTSGHGATWGATGVKTPHACACARARERRGQDHRRGPMAPRSSTGSKMSSTPLSTDTRAANVEASTAAGGPRSTAAVARSSESCGGG